MRIAVNTALFSCLVAAACATQSSDSGRLAAMEDRLARLERRLQPDAPPPEAMADASTTVADAGAALPVRSKPVDCERVAEQTCAEEVQEAELDGRRSDGGGFAWVDRTALPRADSTPAGRQCLTRVRKQCEAPPGRDEKLEWLDAQLKDGSRDEKLTREVRAVIAKKSGMPPDQLDVACTTQFCRMDAKPFLNGALALRDLGEEFDGAMSSSGSHWYAMRRGYSVSSRPAGRNPYKR